MQAIITLLLLCIAELFGMTVWFSVSAVAPALKAAFAYDDGQVANMVLAVQFGFVAGTLFIAITNLADVFNTRRLFALFAVLAAASNALFLYFPDSFYVAIALRFLTGFAVAGVYPPGMKILAGWFKTGRGAAIGTMVGALAIGTALPHWVGSVLKQQWQFTIIVSSLLATLGAIIVLAFVREGPYDQPARAFNAKYVMTVLKYRPTRLAYLGYFGHMWELYAMWTWLPVFLGHLFSRDEAPGDNRLWTFIIIASGAAGSLLYGFWADRIGRSRSTITAMAISGLCCFSVGYLQDMATWIVLIICVIWGITVVADSAQFSVAVSELCDPEYLGTALTLQTCIGFLITMVSIRVLPLVQTKLGWGAAFTMLGFGPVAGIIAMVCLYKVPEALKMAGGNR